MSAPFWSFALSWSRVAISAALFLIATRFLTLAEIGLFATSFAPIRMTQGIHKSAIPDAVIILGKTQKRQDALFAISLVTGTTLTLILATIGAAISPLLLALSPIPILNCLAAVPDGTLRKSLRLRALALRTLCVQLIAVAIALWMLLEGWGVWALATFVLINATLTCATTAILAGWAPRSLPNWQYQSLVIPKSAQIITRVLLSTAQFPIAQLLIGLCLGSAAAGAFQIATRMMELIEALTLSPLRYMALPRLSATQGPQFNATLSAQVRLTATLSAWIWSGTIAATPAILSLAVGTDHALAATPVLRAIAPFALLGALLMPLTQALNAKGETGLVLIRTVLSLAIGTTLTLIALPMGVTYVAAALSLSALIVTQWYLPRALDALKLTAPDLTPLIPPLCAAMLMAITLWAFPMPLVAQVLTGTALYAALLSLSTFHHGRTA